MKLRRLHDLTLQQYEQVSKSGMFWELYPEATLDINQDLQAVPVAGVFDSNTGKHVIFYDIRDEEAVYEI